MTHRIWGVEMRTCPPKSWGYLYMTKKYKWPARMPTKSPHKLVVVWRETGREAHELREHTTSTHHVLVALTYFPRRMKLNNSSIQGKYMAWIEEVQGKHTEKWVWTSKFVEFLPDYWLQEFTRCCHLTERWTTVQLRVFSIRHSNIPT